MNKIAVWIIGGIIVVGGIAAVFVYTNKSVNITNTDTGQTTEVKTGDNAIVSVDACDILTQDIAKNILGDAAKKGDLPESQASTKDVSVSSCVYTARIDANGAVSISNTKGASVLVRAAKTNAGSDSNKSQFGTNKPAGVQDVDGIGDKAFFNPAYGQLNVLKGGNWYIIANYSGTAGSGTLESDKQLADLLQIK
ncbi:MAG: hypothetical protein AAB632_03290 [Patescibacteria group bacterium]